MAEERLGVHGHYEWINPLEAEGKLRKYFPAKGKRYTVRDFRHIVIGLGGFPKSKEDILPVREAYQYDPKTDTIKVRFWDIALLTFPNQTAEDLYWDSREEQEGINSLSHNGGYIEWKRRVTNRKTKKGVYGHGEFGDEIERELDRRALHVLNPMRVVRYVGTELLRRCAFTDIKRDDERDVDALNSPSAEDLAAVAGRDEGEEASGASGVEGLVRRHEEIVSRREARETD